LTGKPEVNCCEQAITLKTPVAEVSECYGDIANPKAFIDLLVSQT
jgi:hypothetical protein